MLAYATLQELTVELLSQGADVAISSFKSMNTPLHFASLNNHKAIVEVLLRSGADPSTPNAEGLIPAELTTEASIRDSLMNTNWMSRSHVQPRLEQHHSSGQTASDQGTLPSNSLPQQLLCSDLERQLTITEASAQQHSPPPLAGESASRLSPNHRHIAPLCLARANEQQQKRRTSMPASQYFLPYYIVVLDMPLSHQLDYIVMYLTLNHY
jgi:hypothetical protein